MLEQHRNGARLRTVETMLAWAESRTWKGQSPTVVLNTNTYHKGIALTKKKMFPIEERLQHNPIPTKSWTLYLALFQNSKPTPVAPSPLQPGHSIASPQRGHGWLARGCLLFG
ncbi:MAG: hypothetical protein ACFB0G_11985 [Leptolyngbyaceae cyanobacterium]